MIQPRLQAFVSGPEHVLLVEVSDTTLAYDRNVKLPLYARAVIREVWKGDLDRDLPGGNVERHTDASSDGYRSLKRTRRGETV